MTANGHAANGADAPSKMPHKPWRDDEEDANSLRAIVRANFPRSVDDAFPFLRVARTMTRDDLKNDLVAGLTVAVMVIPQGMAYAALASLRPEIGLYSCILPILTYALVGSSRQLAVGPVAMVALLTTAGLSPIQDPLEDPDQYQRLASTLAFLVGIMQAGMGLLRLEFIARFLPHPVLSGFTSAAAVVIGSSQIKDGEFLFGYFWLFLVFLVIFVWAFRLTSCFVYRAKRHSRIRLCGIRGARDWPVVRRRRRAPGLRGDHDPVGARVSGLLGFVSSCTRCESNIRLV